MATVIPSANGEVAAGSWGCPMSAVSSVHSALGVVS